jgi:DOPA 4,5-dioxygenase
MSEVSLPKAYHAHVYFDADSRDRAWALRGKIIASFNIEIGRFHEKPVGPHPRYSYQIAFDATLFGSLIPWLAHHREGLTVFVHSQSGDDWIDHTQNIIWLGPSVPLNIAMFRRQ